MAFELIYTSVEKGIKPGSKGFCTVAFTDGMPANYIQIAESLSAYRNLYPPHDVNYPKNPVAFSHLSFVVGGRELHFVTRVSAYGTDYSGRNNKLAHSIILRNSEFLEQGPVSVMQSGGFFRESWDEEPHLFRTEKRVTVAAAPVSTQAKAWQQATGDAGWAGFLAQAYLDAPNRSSYLVFNSGMDVLPLIAEAVALMPPEFRWNVTFNTYFISEVRGSTCAWRCVLPDSPLLSTARRSGDTIIDLTSSRGKCNAAGPLVEAARSGQQPDWSDYQKQHQTTTTAANAEDDDSFDAIPARKKATPAVPSKYTRVKTLSPSSKPRFTPPPPPPVNKATNLWVPIAIVAAAMILAVIAGIIVLTRPHVDRNKTNDQQTFSAQPDIAQPDISTAKTSPPLTQATDEPPPQGPSNSLANTESQAGDPVDSPSEDSHAENDKANKIFEDRFKAITTNDDLTKAEIISELTKLQREAPLAVHDRILDMIAKDLKLHKESLTNSILEFRKGGVPFDWKKYSVNGKSPQLKFYSDHLIKLEPRKKVNFSKDKTKEVGHEYEPDRPVPGEPNKFTVTETETVKEFSVIGNAFAMIHATGEQFQDLILLNADASHLKPQVQLHGKPGNWQIEVPEILKHIIDAEGVTAKCTPIAISNSYDVKLKYLNASSCATNLNYSIEISASEMSKFDADVKPATQPKPQTTETTQDDAEKKWAEAWKSYDKANTVLVKKKELKKLVTLENFSENGTAEIRGIFEELKKTLFTDAEKKELFDKEFASKPTIETLQTLLNDKDYQSNSKINALYDAVHKGGERLKHLFMSTHIKTEKKTKTPPPSKSPKTFTPKTLKLFHYQSGMKDDLVVEITLSPPLIRKDE